MKGLLGTLCLFIALAAPFAGHTVQFQHNGDVQVRHDDRSGTDSRDQYRLRWYPTLDLGREEGWSLHGFAATGNSFGSSHNTFGSAGQDRLYARHLFLRHSREGGKTEIGVIPTVKGAIASTGLSKHGWIKGVRQVFARRQGNLEIVLGQLDDVDPSNAIELPDELNYIELEYSSRYFGNRSYEFGLDRVLESNFARTEVRYKTETDWVLGAEVIYRLSPREPKVVISADGAWRLWSRAVDVFAYYSYVTDEFGPRNRLTEDFLDAGHGVSLELSGKIARSVPLSWFTRLQNVDGRSRFMVGLKYAFAR